MSLAPAPSADPLPNASQPLVRTEDVRVHFPITEGLIFERRVGSVRAVDGVSLDVQARRDARPGR